jgi:hypothetical protein
MGSNATTKVANRSGVEISRVMRINAATPYYIDGCGKLFFGRRLKFFDEEMFHFFSDLMVIAADDTQGRR